MKLAALGFREHTGWAALVAVGGSGRAPHVVIRSRIELCNENLPRAVYHAARDLDLPAAQRLVHKVEVAARRAAEGQLERTMDQLAASGYQVGAAAIAGGARRLGSDLAEILASHPLVHTAEGQLYREALADAAEHRGLPVVRFLQQELFEEAAKQVGLSEESMRAQLTGLGRALGPPWGKDQREAAAAAWLALARSTRRKQPARAARQR
jgi:hypothetical protein